MCQAGSQWILARRQLEGERLYLYDRWETVIAGTVAQNACHICPPNFCQLPRCEKVAVFVEKAIALSSAQELLAHNTAHHFASLGTVDLLLERQSHGQIEIINRFVVRTQ